MLVFVTPVVSPAGTALPVDPAFVEPAVLPLPDVALPAAPVGGNPLLAVMGADPGEAAADPEPVEAAGAG